MKTIKTVEPYAVKYRIWDTVDYGIVYETSDMEELSDVFYTYFNAKISVFRYCKDRYGETYYGAVFVSRYIVKTEFGDDVELLPQYRRYRPKEYYHRPLNVVFTKKNPNKIKKGYFDQGERIFWCDNEWHSYPYISRRYYRRIRTQNERRQNTGVIADYGANAVRGRRRKRQLPSSWDDIPTHSWDLVKSWKHNSKRRHQWKVK